MTLPFELLVVAFVPLHTLGHRLKLYGSIVHLFVNSVLGTARFDCFEFSS